MKVYADFQGRLYSKCVKRPTNRWIKRLGHPDALGLVKPFEASMARLTLFGTIDINNREVK